ncbi:MAG TPA: M48 family metallopeptidase [Oligoflexia bacterium]|nr:M48 family metallopeptidase [Oligoflexia bacterium]HMP26422.1 M48 family metallopeptidase [Oligoflexia bacterium]
MTKKKLDWLTDRLTTRLSFKIANCLKIILLFSLTACATRNFKYQPGQIPTQHYLSATDEQYGQTVFSELGNQYQLSRNDDMINRVRDITDRLTKAAMVNQNPWQVHLFEDDRIKNASATRGNYIFIWSGMVKAAISDSELAAILAHEIAHVLAGHTAADPHEEVGRIFAGIAGIIGGQILYSRGYGPLGDLAEFLLRNTVEAIVLNPNLQIKELEADRIGLFIAADAGYDPEEAVRFWERAKNDPDLRNETFAFLSTHPSNAARLKQLHQLLPDARDRYDEAQYSLKKAEINQKKTPTSITKQKPNIRKKSLEKKSIQEELKNDY